MDSKDYSFFTFGGKLAKYNGKKIIEIRDLPKGLCFATFEDKTTVMISRKDIIEISDIERFAGRTFEIYFAIAMPSDFVKVVSSEDLDNGPFVDWLPKGIYYTSISSFYDKYKGTSDENKYIAFYTRENPNMIYKIPVVLLEYITTSECCENISGCKAEYMPFFSPEYNIALKRSNYLAKTIDGGLRAKFNIRGKTIVLKTVINDMH